METQAIPYYILQKIVAHRPELITLAQCAELLPDVYGQVLARTYLTGDCKLSGQEEATLAATAGHKPTL